MYDLRLGWSLHVARTEEMHIIFQEKLRQEITCEIQTWWDNIKMNLDSCGKG